ncbi:transcriptional regulator with XRE-family HTH domain [Bacillus sp. RC242]
MSLGQQLKKFRELESFSQEDVAQKIGVTRQAVYKWENDKSYPDIDNLILLSELYKVTLDELIKGNENFKKKISIDDKSNIKEVCLPEKNVMNALEEHKNNFTENNKVVKYYTVFSVGAFGALSVPILFGEMNVSSNLPFLLAFIISNIWILCNKNILWDKNILEYFRKMIYFTKSATIAVPLALFSLHIIINKNIETFSIYYLLIYFVMAMLYLTFLRYLLKNKQTKKYSVCQR